MLHEFHEEKIRQQCKEADLKYRALLIKHGHLLCDEALKAALDEVNGLRGVMENLLAQLDVAITDVEAERNRLIARQGGENIKVAGIKGARVPESKAQKIIREISAEYGVTFDAMRSTKRQRPIVRAKQACFYRIYNETNHSFPTIARMFKLDHTTVLHGYNKERERREAENNGLGQSRS